MVNSSVIFDLGSIASWLSALGSLGAIITALYLAGRSNKISYKTRAYYSDIVNVNDSKKRVSVFYITIINKGNIPITVDALMFYRKDIKNNQYTTQGQDIFNDDGSIVAKSVQLPKTIQLGESIKIYFNEKSFSNLIEIYKPTKKLFKLFAIVPVEKPIPIKIERKSFQNFFKSPPTQAQ